MTYRINNWDFFFETAETKKLKKMSWVPVPNKHDGLGYRTLVSAQNGFQTYAAWIVLLQVASKCPIRGLLTDSTGRSLSAADLELKTGIPKHVFEKAMTPLCEVGWLEEVIGAEEIVVSKSAGTPGEHPGTPGDDPGTPGLKGREGKEGNIPKTKSSAQNSAVKDSLWNAWGLWVDVCRSRSLPDPIPDPADTSASKKLKTLIADKEDLKYIMKRYLEDIDRYLESTGHPLRELPKRINKYKKILDEKNKREKNIEPEDNEPPDENFLINFESAIGENK